MAYVYLLTAIIAEVAATTLLKDTMGFSVLVPSIIVIAAYLVSFYFLSLTLQTIPVGVAYAFWSGIGIAGICAAAYIFHKQQLDAPALLGIVLILAGVLIIKLFSKTVS